MAELISSAIHIARKDYVDDAGVWLEVYLDENKYDTGIKFSEWREIIKLKNNGWKIKKGQRYQRSTIKYEGKLGEFKCNPEIDKICQRLDLYIDC